MMDRREHALNPTKWLTLMVGCLAITAIPVLAMAETDAAAVVKAREIAFAQSMADRDFEAFESFISCEAIFFNGNEPIKGIAAVKAAWAGFFEGPQAPFSWAPDRVEVLESGGLAISSGPVYAPTGEVIGRFNSIWRKEADGLWRVVFDKGS